MSVAAAIPPNPIPKRILFVEDNYFNRQVIEEYLVFWGYQVLALESGSGYFQALAEFQPHLVLLDLKLPDIDGYTLLEQTRQIPECQLVPVIVVSAYAFDADQQRALKLGASRYFVKPVSPNKLKQAVEEELYRL